MFSDFIHFSSPEIRNLLPGNLPEFLRRGELVKHNPVRDVFKTDGFFIKLDHRKYHTFTHEFNIAQALTRSGIPVVEHLAYGRFGNENFLITRELAGAVTAEDFLNSACDTGSFITAFTKLMELWQTSKFLHTDPHFGNLLWSSASSLPTLVDVHDVRRRFFPWSPRPDISRFIFNLRGKAPHRTILELLAKFDVSRPEQYFDQQLTQEFIRLKSQWPKRRNQLFNAYPKFSLRCGQYLVAAAFGKNFNTFPDEHLPDGPALFAASFFLTLAQIPHRRCIALNTHTGAVKFEFPLSGNPDAEACALLQKQLELCSLNTENLSFCTCKNLAALNDISSVAVSPLFQFEG